MTEDILAQAEALCKVWIPRRDLSVMNLEDFEAVLKRSDLLPQLLAKAKRLQEESKEYHRKAIYGASSADCWRKEAAKWKAKAIGTLLNEIERLRAEREVWIKHYQENSQQAARIQELEVQNQDLMANCNDLRQRCWKAEAEIERLHQPNACDDWGNSLVLSTSGGTAEGKIGGGDKE